MNPNVKKWLNRGGLVVMIVGVVAITVGGGDTDSAMETVGKAASIAGAVGVFVRELLG